MQFFGEGQLCLAKLKWWCQMPIVVLEPCTLMSDDSLAVLVYVPSARSSSLFTLEATCCAWFALDLLFAAI